MHKAENHKACDSGVNDEGRTEKGEILFLKQFDLELRLQILTSTR
jgi:hypothetical protein